jgi:Domain of unknown function (DUF4398)
VGAREVNSILRRSLILKRLLLIFILGFLAVSCSIIATRPVQEMSDTVAAIRAAREVQADTLAPELYRQSTEWFLKAKREYKAKNFKFSRDYALKARFYAEQAEFEAIRNGGSRSEANIPDPLANGLESNPETASPSGSAPTPYVYPTPAGISADQYDQRMTEEEARKKAEEEQAKKNAPSPTPTPPTIIRQFQKR